MVLRIKNLNITGDSLIGRGGEVHEIPIYSGICLKKGGGLRQFADLRVEGGGGGLEKMRGVDTPMHTMGPTDPNFWEIKITIILI